SVANSCFLTMRPLRPRHPIACVFCWRGNDRWRRHMIDLRFCCVWNFLVLLAVGFSPSAQGNDNWPMFRGPQGTGVAEGDDLPEDWSATENVEWKAEIPGRGWSSPIVWGNRIFLTTAVNTGTTPEAKKGLYFKGEQREPPESDHLWKV